MISTFGLVFQGQNSGKEFFISLNCSSQQLEKIAYELASEFENGDEGFNVSYMCEALRAISQFEIGETGSYVAYLDNNVQLEERLSYEAWAYSIIIQAIRATISEFDLTRNELDWSEFIMTSLLDSLPE